MSAQIDDLTAPVTQPAELESLLVLADAEQLPARSWQEGSIARTILVILSYALAAFTVVRSAFARSAFLDLASGAWLTLTARYLYATERQPAVYAAGLITLTNSGSASYAWDAGQLHFAHNVTGATYTVQAAETALAPGQSKQYAILADQPGTASSAGPGAITVMVTPLSGVTATNPQALIGVDEEKDPELVARAKEKLGSLSPNGAADAFQYVVKSSDPRFDPQPTSRITRAKTYLGTDDEVHTIVSNAGGAVSGPDVTLLQTRVDRWVSPIPFSNIVASAAALTVNVAGTMVVKGGTQSSAQINAAMATALATYFASQPIGGYDTTGAGAEGNGTIDVDALKAIAFQTVVGLVAIDLTSPLVDLSLAYNQVPQLGTCVFTVTVI